MNTLKSILIEASNDYDNRFDYLLKILDKIAAEHPAKETRNLAASLAMRVDDLVSKGIDNCSYLPFRASVDLIKQVHEENFFG